MTSALLAVFINLATNAGLSAPFTFLANGTVAWLIVGVLAITAVTLAARSSSARNTARVFDPPPLQHQKPPTENSARQWLNSSIPILLAYLLVRYLSLPIVSIAIGLRTGDRAIAYDAGALVLGLVVTAICRFYIGTSKTVATITGMAMIMITYSVRELIVIDTGYIWLSLAAGAVILLIVSMSLLSTIFGLRNFNWSDIQLPDRSRPFNGPDILAFLAMLAYLNNWFYSVLHDVSATRERLQTDLITIGVGLGIAVVLSALHGVVETKRFPTMLLLPVVGMGLSLASVDIATNFYVMAGSDWTIRLLLGREMLVALAGLLYVVILLLQVARALARLAINRIHSRAQQVA